MKAHRPLIIAATLFALISLPTACSRRTATGAAVGGTVGAGAGAAIGSASGNTGTGAAIGDVRDRAEGSSKEQDEFIRRQQEEMKKQQRELEDLKRQKYHDEYFRSRYPQSAD